jgi:serine/threonine-protein kinase
MDILAPFVLADRVTFTLLSELPDAQRALIPADADSVVVTRLNGRASSKVVDPAFAALLLRFRTAGTIIDNIVAFSRERGADAETLLDEAYPLLVKMIDADLLQPAAARAQKDGAAALEAGQAWGAWRVVRLIHTLVDSEVYQLEGSDGQLFALKIAQAASDGRLRAALDREAHMLRRLEGSSTPTVVEDGSSFERPYLVSSWCKGVTAAQAAFRLRASEHASRCDQLLSLCRTVVHAYADLHRRGVLHGDVHPGNILVREDGGVSLIDFGLARLKQPGSAPYDEAPRAGTNHFFEPEYARAWCAKTKAPLASEAGEQHIVAHLLYWLVTGTSYFPFSGVRDQGMRELSEAVPQPFSTVGCAPWPSLERVLRRALDPDPEARFPDMAAFAAELDQVKAAAVATPVSPAPTKRAIADRLQEQIDWFNPAGAGYSALYPQAPHCSVNFGAGGAAYFLHRLAARFESPRLLTWARLWIEKAIADVVKAGDLAFYNKATLPAEIIGPISIHHTMTGLHVVDALIARSQCDEERLQTACDAFLRCSRVDHDNMDLTLGKSGLLLGCALLLDAGPVDAAPLRATGAAILNEVCDHLETLSMSEGFVGIAHGWAGMLYAILLWCEASGTPVSFATVSQLDLLGRAGDPTEHGGLRWPRLFAGTKTAVPADYLQGWCNGAAGMVFLWTAADRLAPGRGYADLAERAADEMLRHHETVNQLCCGRPGQVYSLLALARRCSSARWTEAALQLVRSSFAQAAAEEAEGPTVYRFSLYNGTLGVLLAQCEAENPAWARMPLFELEGWQSTVDGSRVVLNPGPWQIIGQRAD